jgi:hypothetical protein
MRFRAPIINKVREKDSGEKDERRVTTKDTNHKKENTRSL